MRQSIKKLPIEACKVLPYTLLPTFIGSKRSLRDGSKVPVAHVVSWLPAQDRSHHQRRLRNSDCHNHFNRASDERYQNTDHRHRFLTQICRTNHCRHQPAYDNIDIISAFGRDFYAKEDIDASLDSTNDHVMHWTSHICDIHQH